MKLTQSWLKKWVDYPFNESQLAEQLTLAGLETAIIPANITPFSDVIVGRITEVIPHPNADRLKICTVDCGVSHTPKKIVCGANNVYQGLKVATALIGAILPNGFTIQPRAIRKIESQGMLCSLTELGLQSIFMQESTLPGIWELPEELPLGVDLWEQLDLAEPVLHIQIPPNRGDCLSVMGVARELSILNQIDFKMPTLPARGAMVQDVLSSIEVACPDACPRYTGRIIRSINPQAKTPWWILKRLWQGGIRSINAIVDVTNYALLEWGTPLHAFDLDQLAGSLSVRYAHTGEKLHLLNDKIIEISADTVVIADINGPTAIAGIMGGLASAVTNKTVNIFLESAFFAPDTILGHARQYGLMTEASYRFERGVDPELCEQALERVTDLLLTICGGESGPITKIEYPETLPVAREITLKTSHITKILGIKLPFPWVTEQLMRLGTTKINGPKKEPTATQIDSEETIYHVKAPTWRFDMIEAVDLIEELARLFGYERIPTQLPTFPLCVQKIPAEREALAHWRQFLADQGYHEVINYSFTAGSSQKILDPNTTPVELANPISSELNVLRTQLWPGLLTTVKHNQSYRREPYGFFESGTVFSKGLKGITECTHVGGVITGNLFKEQWGATSREVDFFDVKQVVHNSLQRLDPKGHYTYTLGMHPALHPSQSSELRRAGQVVGWIGALHPKCYAHFEVTPPVYLFEWQLTASLRIDMPHFKMFARFPYMRRDIAFWISKDIPFESIRESIIHTAGEHLQNLNLFDVYEEDTNNTQRSFALSLLWQHPERTLKDEEVNAWQAKIIKVLQQEWDIQLRNS